jgi:oxygen-independent coproporphyrinogen-3 oxidase
MGAGANCVLKRHLRRSLKAFESRLCIQEGESLFDPYKQYMYSYPHKTAYQHIQHLKLEQYQQELTESSTTLYFHIPFCESKCGYCNLFSIPCKNSEKINGYIEAVKRHAKHYRDVLSFEGVRFESLIFGGGTPLILSIDQLGELFDIAENSLGIDLERVNTCIETSPNQTSREKLVFLRSKKVNRVSIGVQSFVQAELDKLKRLHSAHRAKIALEDIQNVGFDNVNIDLIYGVPSQTMESLRYSLETALSYQPDEIFAYPLYQRPNTGIYKQFDTDKDLQYRMYFMICDVLAGKGYFQTSMRRFVKDRPSKQSSCGFENMISLGCGGRSYIGNLHFCERYTSRQVGCRDIINAYINRETFFDGISFYKLDMDEMKRRFTIKNLFYYSGVTFSEYKAVFGTDLYGDFPVLQKFLQENWAMENGGAIKLTPLGLSLSDYIGTMLISDAVSRKMECYRDA